MSGDWIEFYPDSDVTLVATVLIFNYTPRVPVNLSQAQKKCPVTSLNLAFRTALRVVKVVEKKQTRLTM